MNIDGNLWSLEEPKVMGILNVTPDSFYEGSRLQAAKDILAQAQKMVDDGADILDVGGYSTRPGASDVPVSEELKRVSRAIGLIKAELPEAIISIDTFRSEVAKAAIDQGAHIINDVSGGDIDDQMFATVSDLRVPYILMHMRGTPKTMKSLATYNNVVTEVFSELQKKLKALEQLKIPDVIIDPGFGFAKTIEHNFTLLKNLSYLNQLGKPLLAGLSRKSMIYKTLNIDPSDALNGTTALNMIALNAGAKILRVHDVKEAKECVELQKQLNA